MNNSTHIETPVDEAEEVQETSLDPETDDTNSEQAENQQEEDGEDDSAPFDAERARKALAKKNAENRNLRERAKKAEGEVTDYKAKYEALQAQNLRREVAYEFNLPTQLADRLRGQTREELIADAEELLTVFTPAKPRVPTRPKPVEGEGKDGKAAPVSREELEKLMFDN